MSKNLQQKQYPNTVLKYLRHPVSYRSYVHKFCPTCFPCFDTDMTCALQRSVSVLAVPGYLMWRKSAIGTKPFFIRKI